MEGRARCLSSSVPTATGGRSWTSRRRCHGAKDASSTLALTTREMTRGVISGAGRMSTRSIWNW
uniref:Uncharacterized protein n=1 Tax=Arundo donax TaxID=35708 RepID=A0A0A9C2G9_ARUDO